MRNYVFAGAMLAIFLGGCTTVPHADGAYIATSTETDAYLAGDAVTQLATLLPPASTPLRLSLRKGDAFGAAMAAALRGKGYAVEEVAAAGEQGGATPLHYVLDAVSQDMYRLTLVAGTSTLSRAYAVENGVLAPAGEWTRKE